ncbi:LacI family DNA-binding transcriptional regulator [Planctomonas deserti]|uniref:LacI family DNA-binding transcriptional regulator n=1 Tax=Planctomonas deserti TaxID=2144185 RepID=UPI001F0B9F7A|nr:LacI family DNA-binding transcriptional regulator [Planctomonas deserti]
MVTMRDVARRADVSIATVSFTVNNSKTVSPATRARVEQAMEELGFRRNMVARALASRRTRVIALLYPALQQRLSGTAVKFFTSAAKTAGDLGYTLVLWPVSNDAEQVTQLTSGGLVDGVLLMQVQLDDPRVDRLVETGTPFAMIGRTRDPSGLTFVDIDSENTTVAALDYLTGLGHRRIALLTSDGDSAVPHFGPTERTRATYLVEMGRRGLDPVMLECGETPQAGRLAADELYARAPETTAVMVLNENAAFGLLNGLRHLGVSVPGDMSILSVGSSPDIAAIADPALTLMVSPADELGRMGVEALVDRLEGREERGNHTLVMCAFHEGSSTAPPRR